MNLNKFNRKLLVTLMLLVLSFLLLNISLPIGTANYYIPEESTYNGWRWDIDENDMIMFEIDQKVTNITDGTTISLLKNLMMFRISSITNTTEDHMGTHNFSGIVADRMWFNDTDPTKLMDSGEDLNIGYFSYNETDPIKMRYFTQSVIPMILPINGSNDLELDILTPVLNETCYYYFGQMGVFNTFDSYTYDVGQNRYTFSNSTDGYFLEAYFYGENGTIKNGSFDIIADFGGGPMRMESTFQRVFEHNIVDEIEWGVNVGDIYYYDWYDGGGSDAYEKYFNVTRIETELRFDDYWVFPSQTTPMPFEVVYAEVRYWDGDAWGSEGEHEIGIANNFYAIYVDSSSPETSVFNFIVPISTTSQDFQFLFNNYTVDLYSIPGVDQITISETSSAWEINISSSTESIEIFMKYEKVNGFKETLFLEGGGDLIYITKQEMTLVDFDLEPQDVIYFKINQEGSMIDTKVIIDSIVSAFYNMTQFELDSQGIFQTPVGQPELQFFKLIIGDFYHWDDDTQQWVYDTQKEFVEGNIYWPISPMTLSYGGPMFMTLGSTCEDLGVLFNVLDNFYDVRTYTPNSVSLYNSTDDKELQLFADTTTGRITYFGGWVNFFGMSKWQFMSFYPKYNFTLPLGELKEELPSDFTLNAELYFNIESTESGPMIINSLLSLNPVNATITNGTVLFYSDLLLINSSKFSSMLFEVHFTGLNLGDLELYFWAFNMSGTNEWDLAPTSVTDLYVYDYLTNTLIINITGIPSSVIFAMSYIDISPPAIPAYPLEIFLSISILALFALVVVKRKKFKF